MSRSFALLNWEYTVKIVQNFDNHKGFKGYSEIDGMVYCNVIYHHYGHKNKRYGREKDKNICNPKQVPEFLRCL